MKSHQFSAIAFAALFAALAACGGEKSPNSSAADSTRDIALTPAPTPPAQPQLRDVPAPAKSATTQKSTTKAPTKSTSSNPPAGAPASAPANAPASAPEAKYGLIPVGTSLGVRTTAKLCTNTSKVGDHVTTTVAETVNGSSGVSIPAGSTVTLEVVVSQFGQNDKDKVKFTFAPVSVDVGGQTYPISGDIAPPEVTKVRRQSTGAQVGKVATGAAIGAVLGKVIGKSGGATAAGAAVGAGGGAMVAAGTADYDGCVADQQRLAITLSSAVKIRAS